MNEQVYDIKAAAKRLGYTDQYIRMLIQREKLPSEMVPLAPGARVTKHVITETAIKAFETSILSKSTRDDNRTKWVAYASFEEMKDIISDLEKKGRVEVAALIRPANKLKTMPEWLEEHLGGKMDT